MEFGVDPALLDRQRPTREEWLQRYARTGDLDALAEGLTAPAGEAAEQATEVAEFLAEFAR